MNPLTYEQIAAAVLAEIRAIYPTGRKPDPDITTAWARVLERGHMMLPAAVWRDAVITWSVSNSEPPTPHDLITAARQVVAQWETDPARCAELAAWRASRIAAKETAGELPPGTVPWGHTTGRELTTGRSEDTAARWEQIKAGVAARARSRAKAREEEHARVRALLDTTEPPGDGHD